MTRKIHLSEKERELLRRIKEVRTAKKLTQSDIADRTGLTQPYVALLENLERIPSEDAVQKISEALGDKSIFELYKSNYYSSGGRSYDKIVVVDFLPPDKEVLEKYASVQKTTMYLPNKTKELLNKHEQKDFYAFKINDGSMEPLIKNGDYLIIQYLNINVLKIYDYDKKLDGSIVAICGDDKERHIRKLAINKNKIYLQAINPDFDSFLIEGNHKYKKFKTNRITKEDYDIAEKAGDWRIIGYVISILTENIIHDVFYFS